MVATLNHDHTKNLKDNIGLLEDEKANLQSFVMQHERMSGWLVRILFWRSKADLIRTNRIKLQMIELELARLRYKLFINQHRARTAQS